MLPAVQKQTKGKNGFDIDYFLVTSLTYNDSLSEFSNAYAKYFYSVPCVPPSIIVICFVLRVFLYLNVFGSTYLLVLPNLTIALDKVETLFGHTEKFFRPTLIKL